MRGSGSVRIDRRLTLIEGRLLSCCRLTDISITDYICFSDAIRLLPQPSSAPSPPFASNCSSILCEEGLETMESLRLEEEREDAWSVVLVWLRSACLRIFCYNFIIDIRFRLALFVV